MEQVFEYLAFSAPGWGGNLLRGLVSTLQIALGAYALGMSIGILGALGKIHGGPILRGALEVYTTLIRAVPELVLILLLFYAGQDAINVILTSLGFERVILDGLWVGIYVIGFVQGAYSTEVFRGAFGAVAPGQIEAARAIGMSRLKVQTRVVIPLMLPFALPGLANLWLITTKDTALLAVVGVSELALETRQAAGATRAYFLFYVAAGCLYLLVTLVSNQIFAWLERRLRRGQPVQG
ncbi:ABC transporter permease [Jannaschia aquimarina]|uniref:HisQ protein n=1 Tax=Jannaschia aquimarina TaxID=935700 RepID=A0A0D1DCY6_9RHOB|nr:ABC transporter permease subunit [Jannaschia aquimarina]KIT17823.1 Histidine transport system permease protein HisQ [Jannaschia aquimarina]SNS90709.1 amino acid ABC transporter membrane protein 1, PAAT family [Jannaschia aquimarina]